LARPENLRLPFAALIAFAVCAGSARGDVTSGGQIAFQLCSRCHAIKPGQTSPNPKAPTFSEIANKPQMNIFALRPYLRTPHWTSANLSLRPEDIDSIASYIMSFQSPH
jgi:mono/diheme cytochrome c family protein